MYPGTAEFGERALEIGRWIYVWALRTGAAAPGVGNRRVHLSLCHPAR